MSAYHGVCRSHRCLSARQLKHAVLPCVKCACGACSLWIDSWSRSPRRVFAMDERLLGMMNRGEDAGEENK